MNLLFLTELVRNWFCVRHHNVGSLWQVFVISSLWLHAFLQCENMKLTVHDVLFAKLSANLSSSSTSPTWEYKHEVVQDFSISSVHAQPMPQARKHVSNEQVQSEMRYRKFLEIKSRRNMRNSKSIWPAPLIVFFLHRKLEKSGKSWCTGFKWTSCSWGKYLQPKDDHSLWFF